MRVWIKRLSAVLFYVLIAVVEARPQQQLPSKPSTQAEEDIIRVETSLITLPVKVSGRGGKVVYGLTREQFRVFENGVEQEIAYFEPPAGGSQPNPNSNPLVVALMLDISDSTEFKLAKIKSAALAFVEMLRPGDRAVVVSFDKQVRVLTEVTDDRNLIRQSIERIKTGEGTSLYEALSEVINKSFARLAGRKAIVLLTDGVDTASKNVTFDQTIRAAEASDIAVFPIQYPTYSDFSDNPSRETYTAGSFGAVAHVTRNGEFASEAYKRATLYLHLLADKTAGHFQFADSARNLASSFEAIARELRGQYVVAYYPKDKSASQRRIQVKVAVPAVKVRTRQSYIYKEIRK